MAKTAINQRKDKTSGSIRRRLTAAICMLLISVIMLVTSTYAWFTLSTAPEIKGIETSIAGNGSLEIALMPGTGLFSGIGSGRNASGAYAGGTQTATVANANWGNIINLEDPSYGLNLVELRPARLNLVTESTTTYIYNPTFGDLTDDDLTAAQTTWAGLPEYQKDEIFNDTTKWATWGITALTRDAGTTTTVPTDRIQAVPFSTPEWGFDGRITRLNDANLRSYDASQAGTAEQKFVGTDYGVRVITDGDNTYGYVVDLAFRLNSTKDDGSLGSLLLQVAGAQRVYSDGSATATQGGGSNLWFQNDDGDDVADATTTAGYLRSIRFAFVQNFGNANQLSQARVIAYARANTSNGDLYLCDYTGTALDSTVILDNMEKNRAYQISVIVWLDGDSVTNADMAINNDILSKATLNLQFATDVTLVPAKNSELRENPPAAATTTTTVAEPAPAPEPEPEPEP